jgi:hypothetical protein
MFNRLKHKMRGMEFSAMGFFIACTLIVLAGLMAIYIFSIFFPELKFWP